MKGLSIPDRGRLIADVVPFGERPRTDADIYGVIRAWRAVPDRDDYGQVSAGLHVYGEAPDGTQTRVFIVPEGVIAQGLRERVVAAKVALLLIAGKTTKIS